MAERVRRRRMKNHPVRRGLVDHRGSTGAEWQEWPTESSLMIEHHGRSIVGPSDYRRGVPLFRVTGAENVDLRMLARSPAREDD